uniref:Ubiquitin carboxyl-terminal hydrolase 47 n=1 Tax=Nothoprocta perdicaria TaxID=30464 RepID=A0A8C6ZVF8_NOTPE
MDSHLWKLLDRHANTIRLYVSLPEQPPASQFRRTVYQKSSGDSGNLDEVCERVKGPVGNMKYVNAVLEESTEKLKSYSLQQQQQEADNGDSSKSTEASDFENIESPVNEIDSSASAENRELENQIQVSDPENLQSEERSDSDVNNDRSTSSVDSDILSSSHSSDTLCNVDSAPIPLANGLDSHSITSSSFLW